MYTIHELVTGCLKGEKHAQKMLFCQYYPSLLGLLYRYTNSKAIAEDLLQETFIKIFNSLSKLKSHEAFELWMKRIAINTALTYLRKKNKMITLSDDIEIEADEEENTDNFWLQNIASKTLYEEIASLPDGYRTVINLYAIENYSHKEISKKLHISENTSRTQYMKAKKLLKLKLLKHIPSGSVYEK